MIGTGVYFLVGVIIFFFLWKKYSTIYYSLKYKDDWIEHSSFYKCFIIPLLWPIALPTVVLWKILNSLYNKLNKSTKSN
jgi:hypothetical protein